MHEAQIARIAHGVRLVAAASRELATARKRSVDAFAEFAAAWARR